MSSRKNKKKTEIQKVQETEEPRNIGVTGFLGIGLLAGALFNVPAILKVPETNADKMMLVIVLSMALGGILLLCLPRKQ